MTAFIGIDLGTTFSALATIDSAGRPTIIECDGRNILPSCVTLKGDKVEVGEFARKTWGNAPDLAAARFKRDMGNSKPYSIRGRQFTPTELSSFVLQKLKQTAIAKLGPIGEAVVTIPANFAHEAREATMAAAKAAGLNISHIINEPTAAALYYAYHNQRELAGIYAVYDLGGGTFDVSIIRVDGENIEVICSNGITKLGGDDFDRALVSVVKSKYEQESGTRFSAEDFTINDAEEHKISLSQRKRTTIKVGKYIFDITREEFEEAISSYITQTELLSESTIEEAGISAGDIQAVFLAGGSTRIPLVTESVRKIFKTDPTSTINVDEVVALGAALYAAYKGNRANLNAVQRQAISQISVGEFTAKCFGTLAQVYDPTRDEKVLQNAIIIRKGERIPCSKTETFSTVYDGQAAVGCEVTESTAPETDPRFVKIIWNETLELGPGRPKGQEIRITYSYDSNQIMKCSFVDVATGKETKVDLSMTSASTIDVDEIKKFLVE